MIHGDRRPVYHVVRLVVHPSAERSALVDGRYMCVGFASDAFALNIPKGRVNNKGSHLQRHRLCTKGSWSLLISRRSCRRQARGLRIHGPNMKKALLSIKTDSLRSTRVQHMTPKAVDVTAVEIYKRGACLRSFVQPKTPLIEMNNNSGTAVRCGSNTNFE